VPRTVSQALTPIEPRNFNRSWDTRCTKADVRKITVHDGRSGCGTLLSDLDVHPVSQCRSSATPSSL
jgi:integrase